MVAVLTGCPEGNYLFQFLLINNKLVDYSNYLPLTMHIIKLMTPLGLASTSTVQMTNAFYAELKKQLDNYVGFPTE